MDPADAAFAHIFAASASIAFRSMAAFAFSGIRQERSVSVSMSPVLKVRMKGMGTKYRFMFFFRKYEVK